MILTILSLVILLAGIALLIILDESYYLDIDIWFPIGIVSIILGASGVIVTLAVICAAQIPSETNYQAALYEKSVLEYRLENQDDNIVGNELLFNDIVKFNNTLRQTKRYANSPWVNWFYNQKIATIDYVTIDGIDVCN